MHISIVHFCIGIVTKNLLHHITNPCMDHFDSLTATGAYIRHFFFELPKKILSQFLSPQPVKGNADLLSSPSTSMSTFPIMNLIASMS